MIRKKSNFELPIRIEYQPPSRLLHFLTLTHAMAIISLFVAAVPAWLRCLLCLGIVVSYFYYRHSYYYTKNNSIRLNLSAANEWICIVEQNSVQPLRLLTGSFVHPELIIMRFIMNSGKLINVILVTENCDPNMHRRLRVRLRYQNLQ